jgi:mono/diheme cytochrome c family protein
MSGQAVFGRECGACHSLSGGQSPRQQGGTLLGLKMRRVSLLQFADEMPVAHRLSRAEGDAVVNYILSLQRDGRVRSPG